MAKQKRTTKKGVALQDYKKQLRRIKQFIRRAEKRGFVWLESPVPKQPKQITTKSVERLRKITPDVLYKKAKYVAPETGELITGIKGRTIERKQAAEKAKETRKRNRASNTTYPDNGYRNEPEENDTYYPTFADIVLTNFRGQLFQFINADGAQLLLSWFDAIIFEYGQEAVAQMLQDGAEHGCILSFEVLYKSTNTKTYITEMMDYLPDRGRIYADQIIDRSEDFEWWEKPE